jgi:hypothetical protein
MSIINYNKCKIEIKSKRVLMFMRFVMKYPQFGCDPILYHRRNMGSKSWGGSSVGVRNISLMQKSG